MKKVGFRKKVDIDWSDPFAVLCIVLISIGFVSAILVTCLSSWKTDWLTPTLFGGVGIISGVIILIESIIDNR